MSTLFISHSSADAQTAAELAAWLKRQGHHSLFLDFDVEHGIPAGRDWEQELYRRLRACQAVIVLCSPKAMDSCWCLAELSHARALGKRLFPVRIAPCTLRPQLAALQVIDLVKEPEVGYARLQRALASVFAWDDRRPPYPGLMAFDEPDAAIFFGRDDEIQQASDRLHQLLRFGGPRLLLLLGASGSGKSSLVRAGLLPRLRAAPETWTVVGPLRPRDRPLDALARCLTRDLAAAGLAPARLAALEAATPERSLPALQHELRGLPGREHTTLVLFIDQLEELLTPSTQAERVMQRLSPVLHDTGAPVLMIATLRSDFLGALQTHPAWREVPFEPLTVEPLSLAGFAAVIEGPAPLAGLELEAGLVEAMVADTATQDALPLLAFTLRELWERRSREGRLTLAEYRERLGGLSGSVARAAEAVMAAAAPDRQEEQALRSALLALVRLDDEGRYRRQVMAWQDLPRKSHPLLERFVAARLLIAGYQDQTRTLEIAHEALLRVWRRLNDWLEADREALRARDGLRRAALEWQAGERAGELLVHRGNRLATVEALIEEGQVPLGELEQGYLRACRELRDAERAESRRRKRIKQRWVAATGLILVVAVIGLSWLALSLNQQTRAARQSLADLHWTNAVRARDADPLKASHHFMQVAELALDPARAASAYWAGRRLGEGPRLLAAMDGIDGLEGADFAAAGEGVRLWQYGNDRLWTEAQPGAPGRRQRIQTASPGGRSWQSRIAVYDRTGGVRIHDRRSGALLIETPPAVERLWIGGRDETVAVSAHAGGDAWVWNLSRGERIGALPGAAVIAGVVIAPDGTRMLAWTQERTALLWEATSASPAARYDDDVVGGALGDRKHQVALWRLDGRLWLPTLPDMHLEPVPGGRCSGRAIGARFLGADRLLVWNHGACGSARLWDLATRRPIGEVMRHRRELAPPLVQGERLLTWSPGAGPARLWDVAGATPVAMLPGPVTDARFAARGTLLIAWHGNLVRLWAIATGEPLGLPLRHPAAIAGAAVDDEGERLLSRDNGGSLRHWQLPETEAATTIRFSAEVLDAMLLAKGVQGVTLDGQVQRWSPGAAAPATIQRLASDVVKASFAPRGNRLFTADPAGEVRLWSREGEAFALLAAPGGTAGDDPVAGSVWGPEADRLLFWGARDCTAWLWRVGRARVAPLLHEGGQDGCRLRGAAFFPQGDRLLIFVEGERPTVWDLSSPEPASLGALDAEGARGIRFHADGGPALIVRDDEITLSTSDDEPVALGHENVQDARLHAGTRRVLSWGGDNVRLWDADDAALLATLSHEASVAGARFLPSGERILSWQTDGRLRLWDALNGQPLTPLLPGLGSVPPGLVVSDVDETSIRVLSVAEDRGRLWQWPPFVPAPAHAVQRQERLTGSRLTALGEVEALPAATWQRLAAELEGARPDGTRATP